MNLELFGTVTHVGNVETYKSKSGYEGRTRQILVTYNNGMLDERNNPKVSDALFELKGGKVDSFNFHVGDKGTFKFNLESRDYTDKEGVKRFIGSATLWGFQSADPAKEEVRKEEIEEENDGLNF